ncbi:MAG: ParB/RepB/Spo0J family partition protein [Elusimicrobium sp.]|uniref:ParB/RepB/Spo0J family partition protein n=1 Tax=Candidatus Avelusimicrobium gallicola TaxID=2562704 RepID=A0A928DQ36_9BACT|nr:ParB/RepB/Spo0J family partition protein [Elusimicrobium sp.]
MILEDKMSRLALGKGLDALIKQTQEVVQMTTQEAAQVVETSSGAAVAKIAVNKIVPNRFQPRRVFDEEKLQELAQSIKEHGLTQPIVVVYDAGLDKYEIVVGERRFRATQLAGLTEIDAIVHKHLGDKEMCALALIENIQREDLNPIETALGYRNLMNKFYITQTDLASYCGKSKAAISNSLRLLDLEPEIQQALQEGTLSEGHGRALLMVTDPAKRDLLFKKMNGSKMSVRQAEEAARALMFPAKPSAKQTKPAEVASFENDLQSALGTKVEVKYGKNIKKGTLVIHYHSLDELNNIASRLKNKML